MIRIKAWLEREKQPGMNRVKTGLALPEATSQKRDFRS
jgi:hypothetical protein